MGFEDITTPSELPEGCIRLSELVAYGWHRCSHKGEDGHTHTIDCLWVWHWCDHHLWDWAPGVLEEHYDGRASWWAPTGVGAHDLIQIDPLHIEASVYWPSCCGLHGWIRDGKWVNA